MGVALNASRRSAFVVAAIAAVMTPIIAGQAPSFDVATIKPTPPD